MQKGTEAIIPKRWLIIGQKSSAPGTKHCLRRFGLDSGNCCAVRYIDHCPPFFHLLARTSYNTTNSDTILLTAYSSRSAVSHNLVTASESTRTALPRIKPSGNSATSLHSFLSKQQGSQDSSLGFHLSDSGRATSLSTHFSLLARSPPLSF